MIFYKKFSALEFRIRSFLNEVDQVTLNSSWLIVTYEILFRPKSNFQLNKLTTKSIHDQGCSRIRHKLLEGLYHKKFKSFGHFWAISHQNGKFLNPSLILFVATWLFRHRIIAANVIRLVIVQFDGYKKWIFMIQKIHFCKILTWEMIFSELGHEHFSDQL